MTLLHTPGIVIIVAAFAFALIAMVAVGAVLGGNPRRDGFGENPERHSEIETPGGLLPAGDTREIVPVHQSDGLSRLFKTSHASEILNV